MSFFVSFKSPLTHEGPLFSNLNIHKYQTFPILKNEQLLYSAFGESLLQ